MLLKVKLPKFVVIAAPPTVIAVPLKLALFVTARLVDPSVMAAAEVKSRLPAVLTPASAVAESSWIVTAPAELNVTDPKLDVIAAPPTVTLVPLKLALLVTARLVEASVISPADVRLRVPAVFVPARAVSESS